MTLPDERYRALKQTENFLLELLNTRETPRVPKIIRQRARSLLRHYPGEYYLQQLSEKSPDVIIEKMEPLTRMIKQYEQEKNNDHGS
jgi:hypothetical protein